jgi:hypothetical protein
MQSGRVRRRPAIQDAVVVAHLAIADLVAVAPYHVEVDTTNCPSEPRTTARW